MDVIMPQLGETVTEGTVANWYKKVGDPVKADEPLFEVETDKVTTEIPAIASGVLRAIARAMTTNRPAATANTSSIGPGPSSRVFGPECKLCMVGSGEGSATMPLPMMSHYSSMVMVRA